MPTENKLIFLTLFAFLPTVGTLTSVFNDNKSIRSHKTVEIKVFLNLLLDYLRIQIRTIQIIADPDPGGPKTYGSSGSGTPPRAVGGG
jgi:hypothetical protein